MLAGRSPSTQQNSISKQASAVKPTLPKTVSNTGSSTFTASNCSFLSSLPPEERIKNTPVDIDKENNSSALHIANWSVADVVLWARSVECFSTDIVNCLHNEKIDGGVLLALCENDIRDMRYRLNYQLPFGDLKKLWLSIRGLQERHQSSTSKNSTYNCGNYNYSNNCNCTHACTVLNPPTHNIIDTTLVHRRHHNIEGAFLENRDAHTCGCLLLTSEYISNVPTGGDSDGLTPPMSIDGRAVNIPPEFFKTFISLGYSFLVTWITSFVMVIVHERVPDMKRYPPLPDIFLDNVPHIPWAFHMCEITGTLLFAIWSCVCIFHKYRMVLLRRFFALAGTVFLLRCVTMLITSLSVPGTHLQCDQSDYAVDDTDLTLTEALELRISRAYTIWSGLGMSIQGVRTCGDYMFSGHTVALTLLNFFITEYTPRNLYFLHTLTWLLNMFGIFFILAAHEHYSIDVFVAFYITSRLFLYYHTLANNQALMSRDSTRTRIWFPMFSYFESSVDGIIPNEFDTVSSLLDSLLRLLMEVKDMCMMTAQRFSVDPPHLALATKNLISPVLKQHRNVATSTHSATTTSLTGFQSPTSQSSNETINTDAVEEISSVSGIAASLTVHFDSANDNGSDNMTFSSAPAKSTKTTINNINNNNNNDNDNKNGLILSAEGDLNQRIENQIENNSSELSRALNDEINIETKKKL